MATASSLTLTQKLYVAYYGRPADPFGLEAWATMIDKNGGAVSVDIVNQFGSSAEANSLFGGKTTAQKVNAIYLQCFGREAETDGLRAWVQAIAAYLHGESLSLPPLDPQLCRFGQWLDSDGLAHHAGQPAFEQLQVLHHQLHAVSAALCQLKAAGHDAEALARLPELHQLRDALLTQLQLLLP